MTGPEWLDSRELYREQTGEIPATIRPAVQAPAETHIPYSEYVTGRARLVAIVCASIMAVELIVGAIIIVSHLLQR